MTDRTRTQGSAWVAGALMLAAWAIGGATPAQALEPYSPFRGSTPSVLRSADKTPGGSGPSIRIVQAPGEADRGAGGQHAQAAPQRMSLTLRDAIVQAIANEPSLGAAWMNAVATDAEVGVADGQYDYHAFGTVGLGEGAFFVGRSLLMVGARKKFEYGTTVEIKHDLQKASFLRFEQRETGTLDVEGNPVYTYDYVNDNLYRRILSFGVRQPLMKGAGWGANRSIMESSESLSKAAVSRYRYLAEELTYRVEAAYWAHFAAQEQETVARLALEAAEELLGIAHRQMEEGEISRMDVLVAENGVATRIDAVILAGKDVGDTGDQLLRLAGLIGGMSSVTPDITLADAPRTDLGSHVTAPALQEILQWRSDHAEVRHRIRAREKALEVAHGEAAAQVDAIAEINHTGIGNGLDRAVTVEEGAANDVTLENGTGWFVGVEFDYPFPNKTGNAVIERAEAFLAAEKRSLEGLERDILLSVRNGERAVRAAGQRVEASATGVILAEQQLEGGHNRLKLGHSSFRDVLQFEQELTLARRREVIALADLQIAWAQLQLARGTILPRHGIEFE
ncbi:MAG: TolC family protein [Gemmatimonadota bacterium]|nr:TolC family protein [Gemmatimonadota bacterium]MDP6528652.1 TolC family protein [Gemmatimonadota bacterium]MDP6803063.1 TolC family protein [Gemmatimonadota bacterium]